MDLYSLLTACGYDVDFESCLDLFDENLSSEVKEDKIMGAGATPQIQPLCSVRSCPMSHDGHIMSGS